MKLYSLLQGPDGFPRAVDIEKKDNLYKIKYIPDDCGRYTIEALYDGKPLPQSPIHVQSYSTGNVSFLLHDRCEILTLNGLHAEIEGIHKYLISSPQNRQLF